LRPTKTPPVPPPDPGDSDENWLAAEVWLAVVPPGPRLQAEAGGWPPSLEVHEALSARRVSGGTPSKGGGQVAAHLRLRLDASAAAGPAAWRVAVVPAGALPSGGVCCFEATALPPSRLARAATLAGAPPALVLGFAAAVGDGGGAGGGEAYPKAQPPGTAPASLGLSTVDGRIHAAGQPSAPCVTPAACGFDQPRRRLGAGLCRTDSGELWAFFSVRRVWSVPQHSGGKHWRFQLMLLKMLPVFPSAPMPEAVRLARACAGPHAGAVRR
jgi:hypothetical protein